VIAPKLSIKAILINDEGKILVLQRSAQDEDSPGRVDFPGGGVEQDESYVQAVSREIEEETGIVVPVSKLTLTYTFTRHYKAADEARIRLLFVAHVADSTVRLSHEHEAYWWYTPDELTARFANISWGEAVQFLRDHDLI
jgi:8-oxo-dGTP diphosphatase